MEHFATDSIDIRCGRYEATLLPGMGANLVSLRCGELDILHTPKSADELARHPYSYGIPLLCPPNRIFGGRFTYDGFTYDLPRNLPDGSHLHGLLHGIPWEAVRESESCVRARCGTDTHPQLAKYLPDGLRFEVEYSLEDDGLTQRFTVINGSGHTFPFGLAFHTAFRVPFVSGGRAQDVRLMMPIKSRCELHPVTCCPTRTDLALEPFEEAIADGECGYPPLERPIDRLYKRDLSKENSVCLYDTATGHRVRYSADTQYLYWICWNDNAENGFVGLEPQTWLSNAPCMAEQGVQGLGILPAAPGGQITLTTNICAE